jgi:hypothetical protein
MRPPCLLELNQWKKGSHWRFVVAGFVQLYFTWVACGGGMNLGIYPNWIGCRVFRGDLSLLVFWGFIGSSRFSLTKLPAILTRLSFRLCVISPERISMPRPLTKEIYFPKKASVMPSRTRTTSTSSSKQSCRTSPISLASSSTPRTFKPGSASVFPDRTRVITAWVYSPAYSLPFAVTASSASPPFLSPVIMGSRTKSIPAGGRGRSMR